eukprot:CAMPEP_0172442152 /NCGR_PEP_ID=MMETSP1065-20121228/2626_1 /TAXON_ID=265537 /ORGANISM="Amphiprora paludosa, Strain CCMP125" /LENGTH=465 /DNA_ID=CAMNT_0013191895 /DNA_START=87 /DNA_END=1484 /DNA_ORIENTATION=-
MSNNNNKRRSTLQTVTELASHLRASVSSCEDSSSEFYPEQQPSQDRQETANGNDQQQDDLTEEQDSAQAISSVPGTRRLGGPGPTDVICARGKKALEHAGNKRFRAMVSGNMDTYSKAKTKLEKSLIVSHIIDQVRQASPPGGFLREDEDAPGVWFEVGDAVAREKIGQGFRDLLHTQYRSSTKAKKRRRHESVSSNVSLDNKIHLAAAAIVIPPRQKITPARQSVVAVAPQVTAASARLSIEEQAASIAPLKKRRVMPAFEREDSQKTLVSVFDEDDDEEASFHDVFEPQHHEDVLRKRDSLFLQRDSLFAAPTSRAASVTKRMDSILQKRDSLFQPHDVMSSIAALKSMLSPADLDLDHDNEHDDLDHSANLADEEPEHQAPVHTKRPSVLAQQRASLRHSFSQRRSFTATRNSFKATAAPRLMHSSIFCMDQMPAFCKPDQVLLGGEHSGVAADYIQELNLQ